MPTPAPPHPCAGLRVFISYPRGGAAHTWAERVNEHLRASDADPFLDQHSIEQGEADWYHRIEHGLLRAQVLACVGDHSSEGCRWQQRELLYADRLGLPVVVFRVAPVAVPFVLIERQPVELRPDAPAESLATLARALAAAAPRHRAPVATTPAPTAQRQRELAFLNDLLHGALSTHEARYEPVAGQARRAPTLERTHKGLRINSRSLLQAFKLPDGAGADAAPVAYADVLDAYLALPTQRLHRLAVLGEPGAGKSFSLERVAVHHARVALQDESAPLPLLVRLGLWTREAMPLQDFIERQLGELGADFAALRDQRRAVLLLDGLNEIPPGQRQAKAAQVRQMAEDERFAAVLVSCRERDFQDDYALPFDRLTLQPLTPAQVHRFLHRAYRLDLGEDEGARRAEERFWQMAGGPSLQAVWHVWQQAGASIEEFWTTEDPVEYLHLHRSIKHRQIAEILGAKGKLRRNPRSLLALAANPYLLTVMAMLPKLPSNRAELFDGFLTLLYIREQKAREDRHDGCSVPEPARWHDVLSELAEILQRARPGDDIRDVGTSVPRSAWPVSLTPMMLHFSIDASVLQRVGDDLRFTHQLLQESLASRVLRAAALGERAATDFWPRARWWHRTGWEVVAELAAESLSDDTSTLGRLIAWLAQAQPDVAVQAWRRAGAPILSADALLNMENHLAPQLTDSLREPSPSRRAAIGRALSAFELDSRAGIGLSSDGMPDITWVRIPGDRPFAFQGGEHPPLPDFDISRYPITNRQFQAFIESGGYRDNRWWDGLERRFDRPATPDWDDGNSPREHVNWFEAMAYCRWLSESIGCCVALPTERQWERSASGPDGRAYPWGECYEAGRANCDELSGGIIHGETIGRTTTVGIYAFPSAEGVHDLAGNVWEWCLDQVDPANGQSRDDGEARTLRGGSWCSTRKFLWAVTRNNCLPDKRDNRIGFRVCRSYPADPPAH